MVTIQKNRNNSMIKKITKKTSMVSKQLMVKIAEGKTGVLDNFSLPSSSRGQQSSKRYGNEDEGC